MKIETSRDTLAIDDLFEDSKFFLEKGRKHRDPKARMRYLRASITTAFTGVEALANSMLFVLEASEDLELHELAFVQERRIEMGDDGYFEIRGKQFRSLEQKIKFLHWRMRGKPISNASSAWRAFGSATDIRNRLIHPKPRQLADPTLTVAKAESCLRAVLKLSKMFAGLRLKLEKSARR